MPTMMSFHFVIALFILPTFADENTFCSCYSELIQNGRKVPFTDAMRAEVRRSMRRIQPVVGDVGIVVSDRTCATSLLSCNTIEIGRNNDMVPACLTVNVEFYKGLRSWSSQYRNCVMIQAEMPLSCQRVEVAGVVSKVCFCNSYDLCNSPSETNLTVGGIDYSPEASSHRSTEPITEGSYEQLVDNDITNDVTGALDAIKESELTCSCESRMLENGLEIPYTDALRDKVLSGFRKTLSAFGAEDHAVLGNWTCRGSDTSCNTAQLDSEYDLEPRCLYVKVKYAGILSEYRNCALTRKEIAKTCIITEVGDFFASATCYCPDQLCNLMINETLSF